MKEKVLFSWSGGKDSALALYELRKRAEYQIAALLTVLTKDYDRTSMHGVRRILLEQQAQSLGFAVEEVPVSRNSSNEEYECKIGEILEKYKAAGVCAVVFGDVFLEDLRKRRENNLSKMEMKGTFPLWKTDTTKLAQTFIGSGFKAVITCIDSDVLDKTFVGRSFDEQFLSELPSGVDPCGENGEFHSFVYDGPIFRDRIEHRTRGVVLREKRFYYCDLVPF
ncbi:MAG: diphthine--ammonia ligase [Planctomycetota bacterium]|nr:MAG: diphthine--ammonia ligase [Planctomycetota bacterium]